VIPFVAFSLRRAWQGFWRNGVMSIAASATMAFMLTLLAGFWVVQTGLSAGLDFVESKVQVRAFLRESATPDEINGLRVQIAAMPQVAGVDYVSKEQALADFTEREKQVGHEDLVKYLDSNPLQASLDIRLSDPKQTTDVVQALAGTSVVDHVIPVADVVDRLLAVTTVIRTIGLILLGAVGITVLFIVVNTIRLAVVARASEIEIMRLVGASDAFVRWPFIFEGALVGFIGAAVTLVLFAVAADPLSGVLARYFEVPPVALSSLSREVLVITLGTGLGLGSVGAWLSVRRYLAR
jgi:cell division transport system permease protein